MARSVPCPTPVRAKEPWSSTSAFSGVPPRSRRAKRPMRQAPAVWEELGPTMTGPMMSRSDTIDGNSNPAPPEFRPHPPTPSPFRERGSASHQFHLLDLFEVHGDLHVVIP